MTTITYDYGDLAVRKIVVGKDCYSKYCIECQFKIDAFWEKKEGFKYGWMGIICCMYPCPNGVAWGIELGRGLDFDPALLWEPVKPVGDFAGYESTKPSDKKWYQDD